MGGVHMGAAAEQAARKRGGEECEQVWIVSKNDAREMRRHLEETTARAFCRSERLRELCSAAKQGERGLAALPRPCRAGAT